MVDPQGKTILEFVRTVRRGPSRVSKPVQSVCFAQIGYPRHTTDDLYVVARLLLLRDVNSLISSLYEYEQRPRHPQKKDESGHQRQRGFDCEFRPVEVAYFVSQFCANKHILEACIAHLNKHSDKIQNWPHQDMTDYTGASPVVFGREAPIGAMIHIRRNSVVLLHCLVRRFQCCGWCLA